MGNPVSRDGFRWVLPDPSDMLSPMHRQPLSDSQLAQLAEG